MDEQRLLERITVNPAIFGGKPIIRGDDWRWSMSWACLRPAITAETILEGYPWLEAADIHGGLIYARRVVRKRAI